MVVVGAAVSVVVSLASTKIISLLFLLKQAVQLVFTPISFLFLLSLLLFTALSFRRCRLMVVAVVVVVVAVVVAVVAVVAAVDVVVVVVVGGGGGGIVGFDVFVVVAVVIAVPHLL